MAQLKLTYFDIHGGRGEVARIALSIGKVEFEDQRIPFSAWSELKPKTPYGGLPVLERDGVMIAQSNAINRYVGRLAGLYPQDLWQAAICDETMDAVEDIVSKISTTMRIQDEAEKRARRLELVEGPIPFYLQRLQARLQDVDYFADGRLTVADLKVFVWLRHLRSGVLDHVPADMPERIAPKLVAHYDRVSRDPGVTSYYARHGVAV